MDPMGDHALHHDADAHQEMTAQDAAAQDTDPAAAAAEQTAAQETANSLLVALDDHPVALPQDAPAEGEHAGHPPQDATGSFSAAQTLVGASQQASDALDRLGVVFDKDGARTCSTCGQPGHNKRTCPRHTSEDDAAAHPLPGAMSLATACAAPPNFFQQAFAVGTGLMSSPQIDKWGGGQRSQQDLMMLAANGSVVPVHGDPDVVEKAAREGELAAIEKAAMAAERKRAAEDRLPHALSEADEAERQLGEAHGRLALLRKELAEAYDAQVDSGLKRKAEEEPGGAGQGLSSTFRLHKDVEDEDEEEEEEEEEEEVSNAEPQVEGGLKRKADEEKEEEEEEAQLSKRARLAETPE